MCENVFHKLDVAAKMESIVIMEERYRAASREQPACPGRIPVSPAAARKGKRASLRTRVNRSTPRPKRSLEARRPPGFWAPPRPFASHPAPWPPRVQPGTWQPAAKAAKRKAAVSVRRAGAEGRVHGAGHPEHGRSSYPSLNLHFVSVQRMNCSHLKRVLFRWMVY